MNSLKLRELVPLFELPAATEGTYSLENDLNDQKGWSFIVFFHGTWCLACKQDLTEN